MGRKAPEDEEMEERVRAHVRQRMRALKIGVTEAAEMAKCDQGNLTRILMKQRGLGLGMAARLIVGLKMDPLVVFTADPAAEFFRPEVPRPPDEQISRK